MAFRPHRLYTRNVLLRLVLLIALPALALVPARAARIDIPAGDQPVIFLNVRQANVVVRSAAGDDVRVVAPRAHVDRTTYVPDPGDNDVEILSSSIETRTGRRITLPLESFRYTPLRPGPHLEIRIRGASVGRVSIELPQRPSLLLIRMENGRARIDGVQGATIVAKVHRGGIALRRFTGSAYLQVDGGPIALAGSRLEHVRLRTGMGPIVLESCTLAQVQASSVLGDVVVDDAVFVPGVARFDSRDGAVALGIGQGGAQVSGTTARGGIFTQLDERSHPQIGDGSLSGAIHGGGPAVTLRSGRGSLFLYDAPLDQASPAPRWRRIVALLRRLNQELP